MMVRYINLIYVIILVFMLQSCGKTYKLSDEALAWQPYKVGDILIFNSNKGETDTIIVKSIDSYINPNDPLDISPYYYETIFVSGEISLLKPFKNSSGHIFNSEDINLLELSADKESPYIRYSFKKKSDTLMYPTTSLTLDSLGLLFKNKKLAYNSVEIEAKEQSNLPFSYDLKSFWWSKEYGYVRYEFKDGYYWELQEFIRDNKNILK